MNVLDHIIEVTDARPCGRDRWMGHGPCHGSKKNRDLSIRRTDYRILLHDFTGCELSSICTALGIRMADLFDNLPLPHGQRPTLKPVRVDRVALAFRFDLAALDHRLRAERIIGAGKKLNIAALGDAELDRALAHVAKAYADVERGEVFEGIADNLRMKEFLERDRAAHKRVA